MSALKTKRWVGRIVYSVDINTFTICSEILNNKIKRLFADKEIDRIYIYKTKDELLLHQIYEEEHYKNKHKRPYYVRSLFIIVRILY